MEILKKKINLKAIIEQLQFQKVIINLLKKNLNLIVNFFFGHVKK